MNIRVTEADFEYLIEQSTWWMAYYERTPKGEEFGWWVQVQDGRFVPEDDDKLISPAWGFAHFTEERTSLILARSWLEDNGYDYQVASDEGMGGWVILTDYAPESMRRR